MLLLFPNLLDETLSHELFLPVSVDRAVSTIDGLIAESPKGGRAFLRRFSFPEAKDWREIPIKLLNEHTKKEEIEELMLPLKKGERWGLVSDCGMPCLADPGAQIVLRAHELGIKVETFSGPSSLLFALVLSGLPAQNFAFHGYLEKERERLIEQIKRLEQRSAKERATQLFIETPYRSQKMLESLVSTLQERTLLSVAWDLTLPTQNVLTQPISSWKKKPLPNLEKKPAVFLFFS